MRIVSLLLVALISGCAASKDSAEPNNLTSKESCAQIAREYQAAMPEALVCEPRQTGSCSAGRPLIVAQQNEDGTLTVEGLCLCQHAVNPARTTTLDAILARYTTAGCELAACWCPPPQSMPPTCVDKGVCWGIASLAP